ncbi:stalk domain-containing protein [Paenibacillus sp. y28]|uniref:stalk domain-containing protein n=1 Tax=Paenibacillus sp. y28 TaxID=3129110 RepID=UPI003019A7C6
MKKVIAALALGMLIGSAGSVIAANSETVQATFAQFVIKVNGAEQTLKTDPLVVDGTSYLPVREVAGLLGFELDYDADTRTIDLTNNEKDVTPVNQSTAAAKVEEWVSLRDLMAKPGLSITLGPSDQGENTLSIGKEGSEPTRIYDVVVPQQDGTAEKSTSDNKSVKLKFEGGSILLPQDFLDRIGIQNQ